MAEGYKVACRQNCFYPYALNGRGALHVHDALATTHF